MKLNKWHLDSYYGFRSGYKCDLRYKRRLAVCYPFYLWESIRVIQKESGDKAAFRYYRNIGIKDDYYFGEEQTLYGKIIKKTVKLIQSVLKSVFYKSIEIDEVRVTKYINKYPFISDNFKEFVRNRKLEELGIN